MIEKAVKFLRENPVQYLATVGTDGKAKCRPFMFLLEKEGKLFFCTNNKKEVYKEMKKIHILKSVHLQKILHG